MFSKTLIYDCRQGQKIAKVSLTAKIIQRVCWVSVYMKQTRREGRRICFKDFFNIEWLKGAIYRIAFPIHYHTQDISGIGNQQYCYNHGSLVWTAFLSLPILHAVMPGIK